jgi:hypothetical protein
MPVLKKNAAVENAGLEKKEYGVTVAFWLPFDYDREMRPGNCLDSHRHHGS